MDQIAKDLLKEVAGIEGEPDGAFNIRENSGCAGRNSTEAIQIISKEDGSGIDIVVAPGTKNDKVYIPALVTCSGVHDLVYNDFFIGENADVTIVAGCGVSTDGCDGSEHNGIHRFFLKPGSKVLYLEKHIGFGEGTGERVINPETYMELEAGSTMTMETTQIKGVDSTKRVSKAIIKEDATLVIKEKLMTHGSQYAETAFEVALEGEGASCTLSSRSVARDTSKQLFLSKINGNNRCAGHSECDAIIMDQGVVSAIPEITANHLEAALIHEAAIGKIAGDQIIKLMTLGLTEAEAEAHIIDGFLK
ncbi:MAG: SufD family Fe-S cluster assembly protein [Eubacterium aggregans]|uniref:SufB/SufD family protein n=1 Tax=Eubacterium aggregans TaxID=81409 RepID=UPI002B1ED2DF|nr:SufD family Fe-S cluster assembly protein [Eubacterium aggregans]MEA5073611.1 SufD family Fe-S cluster assembly protein [Eubacterium aggregans]